MHFFRNAVTLLKEIARPLLRPFPRFSRLMVTVWRAVKEFFRSVAALPAVPVAPLQEVTKLPDWLLDEMREIHAIEPLIFPEKKQVATMPQHVVPHSRLAAPYRNMIEKYGTGVSHVFLVPWLNRGGADLLTLNYIQALTQTEATGRIVVISTHPAESRWRGRLPKEVALIEFARLYRELSLDEQRKLLALFLVQMAPPVIHNINSHLGYIVYCMHGQALCMGSKLFASSFCFDYSLEGQKTGYSVSYLCQCYEQLTAVFTDNRSHVAEMMDLFGFTENRFVVHYQPVSQKTGNKAGIAPDRETLNILWAGRLSRQKRPDILLRVAEKCCTGDFLFHVYGAPDTDAGDILERFAVRDNIRYHGEFDGLVSLDCRGYDLFLYTSQWDGLPNILLEAMAEGLPVIAADVGGISELVEDGVTGFLVTPYDDVDRYVDRLEMCRNNIALLREVSNRATRLIASRHSWKSFCEELSCVSEYVQQRSGEGAGADFSVE